MVRSKCFSTGGKAIYRNQVDEIVIGSINGVFLFRILINSQQTLLIKSYWLYVGNIYSLHKHTSITKKIIVITHRHLIISKWTVAVCPNLHDIKKKSKWSYQIIKSKEKVTTKEKKIETFQGRQNGE